MSQQETQGTFKTRQFEQFIYGDTVYRGEVQGNHQREYSSQTVSTSASFPGSQKYSGIELATMMRDMALQVRDSGAQGN